MNWLLLGCSLLLGQTDQPLDPFPPAFPAPPSAAGTPRSVEVIDVQEKSGLPPTGEPDDDVDLSGVAGLSGVLEALIRAHLPNHYENSKQWGKTKEVWSGVKFSRDGLRIDSQARHKLVNHGQWKRYHIDLTQPNDRLELAVDNVRETDAHQLHFEVTTRVPLHVRGEIAHWERGVKLGSLSSEAEALVHFQVGIDLGVEFDTKKLPPDVILRPVVTDARVQLAAFRLRRVGQFDGPLMKPLGQGLREVLDEKLEDTNANLVAKLNRQIAKKQDKLRLSAADWLAKKFGKTKSGS